MLTATAYPPSLLLDLVELPLPGLNLALQPLGLVHKVDQPVLLIVEDLNGTGPPHYRCD